MLPALPLIAVGVVAAAAGWAGAGWWKRLQARRERAHDEPANPGDRAPTSAGLRRSRIEARALVWCPACSTWVVAAEAHGCAGPDCPLAADTASGRRTSG